MQVSDSLGIRIPNGKLDEMNSFDALKTFVLQEIDRKSKTLGNPIEELYNFQQPPANMRIIQYKNYAHGGPFAIKD